MVQIRRQTRGRAYLYGLLIEGVGDDLTASGGVVFCMGRAPVVTATSAAVVNNYEWVPSLIRAPDSVGVSVDTITGAISAESMSFELANSDRAATLVMGYQARSRAYVVADADTTLTLSATTYTSGDTLWAGDEAFRVFSVGAIVTGGREYTVVRAVFGTTQAADLEGAYLFEGRTPYLRFRACRLVRYDPASETLTTVDRGYVERISTSSNALTITVDAPSLISLINGAKINRDVPSMRVTTFGQNRTPFVWTSQVSDYVERIARPTDALTQDRYFQVGDTLASGQSVSGGPVRYVYTTTEFGAPQPEPDDKVGDEFYQLFVVQPSRVDSSSNVLGPSADWSTYQLWRHAYALALGFLRSGAPDASPSDDWAAWSGVWGLGLPADALDIAGWYDVIQATPDAVIDQMVLGWDGEEVAITEYLVGMLRAYGAILAPMADGTISIARILLATIDDFVDAPTVNALPPRLTIDPAIEKAYTTVRAEIGELPWSKPDIVTVEARTGEGADSFRRAVLDASRQIAFDFSTSRAGSDLTPELVAIATQGLERSPRITIDVAVAELTGAAYDIGAWVRVSGPDVSDDYLVDRDFERTRLDANTPAHIGRIVGRRHIIDPPKVELVLELTNFRAGNYARWRAPSGIIETAEEAGSLYYITLEDNVFHFDAVDASYFTPGDVVQLARADGAPVTVQPVMTIVSIVGSVLVVSAASYFPAFIVAGNVIRLATKPDYGIGGDPLGAGLRAYAFIEFSPTTTDTDIYG